jgi:hypothetical protein
MKGPVVGGLLVATTVHSAYAFVWIGLSRGVCNQNRRIPAKYLAIYVVLPTACKKKNWGMNYTVDFSYRGHEDAEELPHHAVGDRGSKQGICLTTLEVYKVRGLYDWR